MHGLHAKLDSLLSQSTFFSVFSVALDNECPFWPTTTHCVIRECSVCHCPDSEIPPAWRPDPSSNTCRDGEVCGKTDAINDVDRSLTGLAALVGTPVWNTADDDRWTFRDQEGESVFVDLRKNPEQYTGYAGEGARKVWNAVYEENCLMWSQKCASGICDRQTCREERLLYKIISGLHASISMHIAKRYLKNGVWGTNMGIYKTRLKAFPERLENLKMALDVVVRAVRKMRHHLSPDRYEYITGNDENDEKTRKEVSELLSLNIIKDGCDSEEGEEAALKEDGILGEFRNAFRNISMIMDCVECEKCRLWGKLQFLGIGTALRILLEDEVPQLERNELIALMNGLFKLSTSVIWVDKMEDLIQKDARISAKVGGMFASIVLLLISILFRTQKKKTHSSGSDCVVDVTGSKHCNATAREKVDDSVSTATASGTAKRILTSRRSRAAPE